MKLLLLFASLSLFLPQAAHAQTPVAIEGLQVIAERQYAADPDGTIDVAGGGVFLVSARVFLYDTTEDAEATWETLVAAEPIDADLAESGDLVTIEKTDIDDVGDRAMVLNVSAHLTDDETGVFRTMHIQEGSRIVTVTAIAGSVEDAEIADDIAKAMIEREPGDGETEYDGLGGSTGGVWEIFLPEDADELDGLEAYADKETRPA